MFIFVIGMQIYFLKNINVKLYVIQAINLSEFILTIALY